MSLGVLGEYGKIFFRRFRHLRFLHILRMRKKNGKYTVRNFYFQQRLTKLKGQYFKKIV
jgi:hypothetical protein